MLNVTNWAAECMAWANAMCSDVISRFMNYKYEWELSECVAFLCFIALFFLFFFGGIMIIKNALVMSIFLEKAHG